MEAFETEFIQGKQLQLASEPGLEMDKEQLLTFYRERFGLFETEREDWLRRLEELRGRQDDYLRMQWELRKREEEIAALQRQLSDSQLQLVRERQEVLRLTGLTEEMKLQERSDRKKILDLLEITGNQENTGNIERKTIKTVGNACSICKYCREGPVCRLHNSSKATKISSKSAKTLILPNEELNILKLDLENAKKQLELQTSAHEIALQTFENDRQTREHESEMHLLNARKQLSELQDAFHRSETAKSEAIKDFLLTRHQALMRERQLVELNQQLQWKLDHSLAQMKKNVEFYNEKALEVERIAEEKSNDFAQKFRVQVVEGEENLEVVKEQYKKLQEVYVGKTKELEKRLEALGEKYRHLEGRRNAEKEGYGRDIEQLRAVIKQKEDPVPDTAKTQKRAVDPTPCKRCSDRGILTKQ